MGRKIRVFLADPSQDFLELLSAALSEEPDLTVIGAAGSGDVAFALLSRDMPDVLVMNLLLPELDGLSLLRRLKSEGTMPRTLVLSAFVNDKMAHATSRLGVDDYLPKPCDLPVLLRRIREVAGADSGTERPRIDDYDYAVREALLRFGINSHLDGYAYLRECIYRALEDRSAVCGITKVLYPELAKRHGVKPASVEHAIRTAVDKAWTRGSPAARRAYFGSLFDDFPKSPSNVRFITAVADFIEMRFEKEDAWKSQ